MIYNYMGKILKKEDTDIIENPSFLNSRNDVDWNLLINADNDGYDTTITLDNGSYKKDIILKPKTKIIRYGSNLGNFTAPIGTNYEQLALPYIKETREYHEYIVKKSIVVKCEVTQGIVAAGFNSPGGAIQYKHRLSIEDSIKEGILKEDMTWLLKCYIKKLFQKITMLKR